jgi:rare lipoprotein A (peptidoglycan hydrolase)
LNPVLAQRELALGAVALLVAIVSMAVSTSTRSEATRLPQAVGSYSASAGSSGTAAFGRHTACGGVIGPGTEGVAHPTLPCGARIYISLGNRHILTQVIDRGPSVPGRQFDLTDALARRLGLVGVQTIHWSYARSPGSAVQ